MNMSRKLYELTISRFKRVKNFRILCDGTCLDQSTKLRRHGCWICAQWVFVAPFDSLRYCWILRIPAKYLKLWLQHCQYAKPVCLASWDWLFSTSKLWESQYNFSNIIGHQSYQCLNPYYTVAYWILKHYVYLIKIV